MLPINVRKNGSDSGNCSTGSYGTTTEMVRF